MNGRSPAGKAVVDEHVAEAPGRVVYGIYRLVKACALYDDGNQAVARLVQGAVSAVDEYCTLFSCDNATVVFVGDAVFIGGDLLRASRETHVIAVELGQMLGKCEVSELALSKGVSTAAIGEFARLVADGIADGSRAARVSAANITGIRTAKVSGLRAAGRGDAESPVAAALRTFAVAIVTVQNAYADLRSGEPSVLRRTKRVAQKIVATLAGDGQALVALAAGSTPKEPAAIAVTTAILAVAAGRQLTTDRVLLTNLAIAALLYDTGQARLADRGLRLERALTEEEQDRLPASTAFMMTAMMKLHHPARVRTALAYEAQSLARGRSAGAPYKGYRAVTPLGRLLYVARRFSELRAHGSIDAAVRDLTESALDASDRMSVKLLVGALGVFPIGTLVELTSGEMGVVISTPERPMDFVRPRVRIMYDARGGLLEPPVDVDLAHPPLDAPLRLVRRAMAADENQERAMREIAKAAIATTHVAERASARRISPPPMATARTQPRVAVPRSDPDDGPTRSIPRDDVLLEPPPPPPRSALPPPLMSRPAPKSIPRDEPEDPPVPLPPPSPAPIAAKKPDGPPRKRTELGIPAPAQVNKGANRSVPMFPAPLIPMKKKPTGDVTEPAKDAVTSTLAYSAADKRIIPREEEANVSSQRSEKITVRQTETDALLSEFLSEEPTTGPRRKQVDSGAPERKAEPVASEETPRKRDPRSE